LAILFVYIFFIDNKIISALVNFISIFLVCYN
jgi:hypothetical protein